MFKDNLLQVQEWSILILRKRSRCIRRLPWLNRELKTEFQCKKAVYIGGSRKAAPQWQLAFPTHPHLDSIVTPWQHLYSPTATGDWSLVLPDKTHRAAWCPEVTPWWLLSWPRNQWTMSMTSLKPKHFIVSWTNDLCKMWGHTVFREDTAVKALSTPLPLGIWLPHSRPAHLLIRNFCEERAVMAPPPLLGSCFIKKN